MKNLSMRARQAGFTLIELLVSVTIGVVILTAVIALYANTANARLQSQALAEMNEDGLYAVRILTQQLRFVGFSPLQPGRPAGLERNPTPAGMGLPVFGCSGAFANAENPSAGVSISTLTCNAANTVSHSIAVTYEADVFNTVPVTPAGAPGPVPSDCKGDSLPLQTTTTGGVTANYYYAENRLYVRNGSLFCTGNGGLATAFAAPAQPLVANVEQLQFVYGVMPSGISNTFTTPAGYLQASEIGNASGIDASADANLQTLNAVARWNKIRSVRICVLMRSSREILAEPAPYYGCDPAANVIVPTDRFARRAFFSTVNLRNSRAN